MSLIQISLSAAGHPFTKGDRVVAKVGRGAWLCGTVQTAGAKIKILFDDNSSASVEESDFKDVKAIPPKTKKMKDVLTATQAKALIAAAKTQAKVAKVSKPKIATKVKVPTAKELHKVVTTPVISKPGADSSYERFVAKLTTAKATTRVLSIEAKVAQMHEAGSRAARRAQDAGPMDIMWERIQPLEVEKEVLGWFIKNGAKKAPPKELMQRFTDWQSRIARSAEYRAAKVAEADAYPNVVGQTVTFRSKRGTITAVVIKQMPGKFSGSGPRYKAKDLNSTSVWTVSHGLVKSFTKTKDGNALVEAVGAQASLLKTMKPGAQVTFTSRRIGGKAVTGTLVSTGPARARVNLTGKENTAMRAGNWAIPFTQITHIDGKPI